jgi:putative DNA primase/helicase
MIDAFQDWRARADDLDLLEVAVKYGAVLKRAGRENTGPCPACGGKDRFSVNVTKHKWHCRGHGGGRGAIGMTMHIAGLSFLQACEDLTGEPNPSGTKAKPLSPADQAERARRRQKSEARAARRAAQEKAYMDDTREGAAAIWQASTPVNGTLAETYLRARGLALPGWPDVLRFHPALPYPGKQKPYPALVCRVDDMGGELTAIWRIYLREDGRKADVPNAKLGLGPAAGGAVRIGGAGPKIAIAEGLESALGYWLLTGRRHPTWAGLSTAGLIGFEVPLGVDHVVIAPDGDRPIKRQGEDFVPAVPAGRKAALALRARLLAEGIACTIAAEPPAGRDYNDLWADMQKEAV